MRRSVALLLALALLLPVLPRAAGARPQVRASTWVIMDAGSGDVLDSQDAHRQTPMASLTKLMTALVAVERGDLTQPVTVVEADLVGESSAELETGETLPLEALLYAVLLPSGNDAATAVARAVGGSPRAKSEAAVERFVSWMNQRAAQLGMVDTHYINPHGLDEDGHHSSVYDLALLARAALANPTLMQIASTRTYHAGEHIFTNTNKLLWRYPGVLGGKTGWTDGAGLCLIEIVERGDRRLIVVLIDSTRDRWFGDATDLADAGFALTRPGITTAQAAAVFDWWRVRTDAPVAAGLVDRSWIWGPVPLTTPTYEPYLEGPGGQRVVSYFDKGRMEITDPDAPVGSGWYVTGGRLAWELISGQRQVGDDRFVARAPARVPLAGDPNAATPTYATLAPLLAAAAQPAGAPVTQRLAVDGRVSIDPASKHDEVTAGAPIPETGHGVASVFSDFLSQHGPVEVDGEVSDGPLFAPPFSITGYPISEPYWVRAPVSGVWQDILVQCFERRCLTYTPANAPGWRVEMANIGRAYLAWLATP